MPEVNKLNLTTLGSDFRVPVFFFHGRFDPYTRPALIEAYARTVTAPHHEFVWFERAGHFPSTPSDHDSSKTGSDHRRSGRAAGLRRGSALRCCRSLRSSLW